MKNEIAPGVYSIKIRLVDSPLKTLNSYIFTSDDRNLLIDTGFNMPECLEDLRAGIDKLGIDMNKTDFFITHLHSDHSGLISQVATPESRVYMSAPDSMLFQAKAEEALIYWGAMERMYMSEGVSRDEVYRSLRQNPARVLADQGPVTITPVEDDDTICLGGRTLRCISTPGHTPGHMCLYDEASEIMALGDNVLFDITPNITAWSGFPNSLGHYLDSLEKMKAFKVRLALPGHRDNKGITLPQRVEELLKHHDERLAEVLDIVGEDPGLTGYTVATRMSWAIRAKSWDDFPAAQKWFAMGEAMSHLNYLVENGKLSREERDGVRHYKLG